MCYLSHFMCHVSQVTFLTFILQSGKLVGEGSVTKGATPSRGRGQDTFELVPLYLCLMLSNRPGQVGLGRGEEAERVLRKVRQNLENIASAATWI